MINIDNKNIYNEKHVRDISENNKNIVINLHENDNENIFSHSFENLTKGIKLNINLIPKNKQNDIRIVTTTKNFLYDDEQFYININFNIESKVILEK